MNNQKPRLLSIFILLLLIIPLGFSACNQELTADDSLHQTTTAASTSTETITPEITQVETLPPKVTVQPTETEMAVATQMPTSLPEPIGGVELHAITENGGLSFLRNTKTHWIRNNGLFWEVVEPIEGSRNWEALAELDSELQAASEQGYEVILIVRKAPDWARMIPNYQCGPIKLEKLTEFANFMHDVVAKYSAAPYHVKYWELGNEPEVDHTFIQPNMPFGCWGDHLDEYYGGGYYAEMLKAVYPQMKAADSEAQVLVGGLLLDCDPVSPPETSQGSGEYKDCSSSKFLEGILQNGGGDYFDGVSFHAYDYYFGGFAKYGNTNWHSSWDTTGPVLIAKVDYLNSLLGAYGYPEKFLINSETAVICGSDGKEPQCQSEEFDRTKANYTAQTYSAALAEGLRANIWYSITGWRGSGLVTSDFQPTFASAGFQFSLQMLENAAYLDTISEIPGAFGYKFRKDGLDLWVIWGIQETPQSIDLPVMPQEIFDVYGNPLLVSQTIELTMNVIYLVFAP